MDVVVERAGPDDWARVRALRLAALTDAPDAFASLHADEQPQPASFWRERLANPVTDTLVATVAGGDDVRDAGLLTLVPPRVLGEPDDGDVLWVVSVWVAPWARGRSVGDALVTAAVGRGIERGATRLLLEVGDHNDPAIALYDRHGFAPTGDTTRFPPPREHITEHRRARPL